MASNDRNPAEVRLAMPEIEQLDFRREQTEKFKSALRETKDLRGLALSRTTKPLKQRVPLTLSATKVECEKYFQPRVVALGLLHHGNPKYELAEQVKLKFAAPFVADNDTSYQVLFNKIMEEIKDLRECYIPTDIKDYDDEKLS